LIDDLFIFRFNFLTMKKLYAFILLSVMAMSAQAQQYLGITGFTASTSTSTNSGITFQMTANASVFVDTVYCRFTAVSGDYRLWYSTTSLTGVPGSIATPIWTELQASYAGVAAPNLSGTDPNIMAIPIPGGLLVNAGTTVRFFAGSLTASVSYTSIAPPVDTFTDGKLCWYVPQSNFAPSIPCWWCLLPFCNGPRFTSCSFDCPANFSDRCKQRNGELPKLGS
jgi:hypothetical protein